MQSLLTALHEPRRRALLRLVWDDERPAGALHRAMPEVTFGAVSQHLRRLREAGLVTVRREGRRRFYRANRDALGPLAGWLETMWTDALDRLSELAVAEDAANPPTGAES